MGSEIRIYNRAKGREELELVYGEGFVKWMYGTPSGQRLAEGLFSRAAFSKAYGAYQSSSLSRHKIAPFIRDFSIPMEEYEEGPFRSFNDFFIRKFKPGARVFAAEPGVMPAFAEARYFGYESVTRDSVFPVKGQYLSATGLMGDADNAKPFEGGPLLLARLCPTDYHRFHFPDEGRITRQYRVAGALHSVNPLALRYKGEIFATNERQVSILETKHFGRIAYIEVGAMCVGLIVQTHPESKAFSRGGEKGYFLFGASTVIVLGERGRWCPSADLLENTRSKREVLVRLGEPIARVCESA